MPFQVTRFSLHGFAVTVAGQYADTPVVVRLAGDDFREHRLERSAEGQARAFCLNNLLGQVPLRFADVVVLGPNGRREVRRRANTAVRSG